MIDAVSENAALTTKAKAIAAMGLVGRDFEGFNVTSPGFAKETFRVWKDEAGRARCSCALYQERIASGDPRFRCEHILAVKFHLAATEAHAENEETTAAAATVAAK